MNELTPEMIQDVKDGLGPFLRLGRAVAPIDTFLTWLQDAANLLERVERRAAAAEQKEAEAERNARAIVAGAQADADRILSAARLEADRVQRETALVAADKDRMSGEVAELQGTKAALAEDVKQLAGAKAAFQPTRA